MTNSERVRKYRAAHPAEDAATKERYYIARLRELGYVVQRKPEGIAE